MSFDRKQYRKDNWKRHKATTSYEKCVRCGKRTYQTEEQALQAIILTNGRAGTRVYREHGGFHLTDKVNRVHIKVEEKWK